MCPAPIIIAQEVYYTFYATNELRVVLNEEFDARALEIEAFNLLLDGQLYAAAKHGIVPNTDNLMKKLQLESGQKNHLEGVIRLALLYFPERKLMDETSTSDFAKLLMFDYFQRGYNLFVRTDDGSLRRVTVVQNA